MTRARGLTGTSVQRNLELTARTLGYLVFHAVEAQKSEPGLPDLIIAGFGCCFMWECKSKGEKLREATVTKKGRLLPGQQDWLDALQGGVTRACVVRDVAEHDGELALDDAYELLERGRNAWLGLASPIERATKEGESA